MKLELKYLAEYLPYGLKIKSMNDIVYTMCDKDGLSNLAIADLIDNPELYTPILRPLSGLTKMIEVNGEKFMPKCELDCICRDLEFYSFNFKYFTVGNQHKNYGQEYDLIDIYNVMQKLFEWHFDIFGLIESGLAIDINTLES